MQIFLLVITVLLFIILLRVLFRWYIEFPNFKGRPLADGSGIDELMPEGEFWELIEKSRKASKQKYEWQCQILTETLSSLPTEKIISFNRTLTTIMAKSYNFKLWEAAYSLNGGCSDDCFEYFRSWLISLGRNKFYWTLKYPRLLFLIGVKELMQNYEGLAYCAYHAYEYKTGSEIPQIAGIDYIDPGEIFNETKAVFKYPELALLAW